MGELKYTHMKVIEGIKVHYDPCDHCGRLPTDKEILEQLALVERNSGPPCAVCGEKAKVMEIAIHHTKNEDIDRWGGGIVLIEPMEKLSGYWQSHVVEISIHPKCAAKALPGAKLPEKL